MFLIIVYDTEKQNCANLHKLLKKYLFWNQNSVFEGNVTEAQFREIKFLLQKKCVPESFISIYAVENEKFVRKEQIGIPKGNTSNIL